MAGTVTDALRWWAITAPDRLAFDLHGDTVSYADLESWVNRVVAALRRDGVGPGDRVGVIGGNSLEYCALALAVIRRGAILAPYNNRLVAKELTELVADSEPTLVFADDEYTTSMKSVAERAGGFGLKNLKIEVGALRDGDTVIAPRSEAKLSDPIVIVYTSGTTSRPKGALFTHATTSGFIDEWARMEPTFRQGMRLAMVLPLGSAAGIMWGVCKVVMHGGTMYLEPRFDPARTLRTLADKKIQVLTSPPIIFEQLAALPEFADADLSAMEVAAVGGARVSLPLLEAWKAKGVLLRQIYGLTEGGGMVTITPRDRAVDHPEECGAGGIFSQIKVVGVDGTDCPAGTPGEIVVRGPGVTPGYWRNPEATRDALVDGWLHTGDIGVLDEAGNLTFVDRLKDLIISGGLNMSPSEIEAVVSEFDGVREVAVIGVADPKFGETPAAIVHAGPDLSVAGLIEYCNQKLADFKVPRYVVLAGDPLPRMASGKIAKRALRDTYPDVPGTYPKVR